MLPCRHSLVVGHFSNNYRLILPLAAGLSRCEISRSLNLLAGCRVSRIKHRRAPRRLAGGLVVICYCRLRGRQFPRRHFLATSLPTGHFLRMLIFRSIRSLVLTSAGLRHHHQRETRKSRNQNLFCHQFLLMRMWPHPEMFEGYEASSKLLKYHTKRITTHIKAGFTALGNLASGMAASLLKAEHEVVVYNRTPAKAQALVDQGARFAPKLADACKGDAVFTMLADDSALETVVFGDGGVLTSLGEVAI